MIAITKRQQVAQIQGSAIYVISDVCLIPLSSQENAAKFVLQTKKLLQKAPGGTDGVLSDSDVSEEEEEDDTEHDHDLNSEVSPVNADVSSVDESALQKRPEGPNRSTSNVAEDVFEKKGQYGRFADRWFSKKGWTAEKRKTLGMSADESPNIPPPDEKPNKESAEQTNTVSEPKIKSPSMSEASGSDTTEKTNTGSSEPEAAHKPEQKDAVPPPNITNTLLPKLLRTTRMLLASKSFFFSYDMDITRRLGTQPRKASDLPLHKSVDPLVGYLHLFPIRFLD